MSAFFAIAWPGLLVFGVLLGLNARAVRSHRRTHRRGYYRERR